MANQRELLAQKSLLRTLRKDSSPIEEKWYDKTSFITKKKKGGFPKKCAPSYTAYHHLSNHITKCPLVEISVMLTCHKQVLAFNVDYLTEDFLKEELSVFSILLKCVPAFHNMYGISPPKYLASSGCKQQRWRVNLFFYFSPEGVLYKLWWYVTF